MLQKIVIVFYVPAFEEIELKLFPEASVHNDLNTILLFHGSRFLKFPLLQ